ncbi:hypothetical protein L6164_033257 [Bauhinia variegata]|uniref:Uncharacterized protein n=1 Tax=Bauhinia variegata TaxID=167791 RepID=A0ACB9KS19_BAUVA|nr:hypothetical protein L6164_033257 [Bauhinia variegata]
MAKKFPKLTKLFFFLVLAAMAKLSHCAWENCGVTEETQLTLYFHDYSNGPNATVIPVAGIAGREWNFKQVGSVYVIDEPITEGPERDSPTVGRCQGLFVTASFDGLNSHVVLSIMFTNEAYNGSTLEIQGTSKQFEQTGEVSVVSGTGKFRFVRGYASFKTVFWDEVTTYAILQVDITLRHY